MTTGHLKRGVSGHLLRGPSGHLVNTCAPPGIPCSWGTIDFTNTDARLYSFDGWWVDYVTQYWANPSGEDACTDPWANPPCPVADPCAGADIGARGYRVTLTATDEGGLSMGNEECSWNTHGASALLTAHVYRWKTSVDPRTLSTQADFENWSNWEEIRESPLTGGGVYYEVDYYPSPHPRYFCAYDGGAVFRVVIYDCSPPDESDYAYDCCDKTSPSACCAEPDCDDDCYECFDIFWPILDTSPGNDEYGGFTAWGCCRGDGITIDAKLWCGATLNATFTP